MFKKFNDLLRRFNKSKDGNFAVTAALLGVPVMVGAMGLAVDYSQGVNSRSHMQSALDAAVWRVGQLDPESPNKLAEMQKYYTANGGLGTVQLTSFNAGSKFVTLRAQATYDMATSMTGIVGLKAVRITTSSSAQLPFRLTSATFKVTKADGDWSKTISLMGRKEGEASYKRLMRIIYTKAGGAKIWVTNPATGAESLSSTGVVQLDQIDSLYTSMSIDADNTAIIKAVLWDLWSNLGLSNIKIAIPMLIQSDDPAYVARMYITKPVNGTPKLFQNDNTDIYERLGCDETETHAWEDGGSLTRVQNGTTKVWTIIENNYNQWSGVKSSSTPAQQLTQKRAVSDFDYTITGRCGYTTGDARLTQ